MPLQSLSFMKEIIYLYFLFSAIDQNHTSLILHAPLLAEDCSCTGLGTVQQRCWQRRFPFGCDGQGWRLHLQLPQQFSPGLWAETFLALCDLVFTLGIHVQGWFRSDKWTLCFGRCAEPPALFSSMEKGSQGIDVVKASPGLQSLWNSLWWGCQG